MPPAPKTTRTQNKKQGFYAVSEKEPHTLQPSIKLWQPAQPIQTKQTNQTAACNPKNKPQKEVVHSEPPTTTNKQKTKQQSKQPKQPPNPHIQYSKQQQKTANSSQKDPIYKEQQNPSCPTNPKNYNVS